MKSSMLVVKADQDPLPGISKPAPNQIYKNVRLSIEERELAALSPGDIRIEICYVGICGTDLHMITNDPKSGYIASSAPLSIPEEGRVIGHEGVGRVTEVGSAVTHLRPGMYVTLESIIVCNRCPVCKQGKFNQCKNAKLLGLEKNGLLGSVVDVPASIAHDLTDFIRGEEDLIAAANIEPAAVAFVGCDNANVKPGDKVVIFGGGPIGLFCAMLCRAVFGASEIHLVEPNAFRRNHAKSWADSVYDVESFFEHGPTDIDVVLEASSVLLNVTRAFSRINANGRVVLLGRRGVPLQIDQVDHMITNEISIKGSRGHLGGAFERVMRLHHAGRIDLLGSITRVVDGIDEILELLKRPDVIEHENCKVVVSFARIPSRKEVLI